MSYHHISVVANLSNWLVGAMVRLRIVRRRRSVRLIGSCRENRRVRNNHCYIIYTGWKSHSQSGVDIANKLEVLVIVYYGRARAGHGRKIFVFITSSTMRMRATGTNACSSFHKPLLNGSPYGELYIRVVTHVIRFVHAVKRAYVPFIVPWLLYI